MHGGFPFRVRVGPTLPDLTRLYAEHQCAVPDVAFEFGPPELHPESRKLRRVIRAFDNPDAV